MASIVIDDQDLVVRQSRAEHIFAVHSDIRVPIRDVIGVTVDSGVGAEPKGIRAPGTHLPGFFVLGTFHRAGVRTFWNIRRGIRAIVITLRHEHFDRLVIEVSDPQATVDRINEARALLSECGSKA